MARLTPFVQDASGQKDLANNSSHNCNAHCVASQLAQSASCVLGRIVAVGMHRDALGQEKILGAQEPLVQLAPVTMFPLAPAENQAWALAQHVCWLGPAAVDDPVSMEEVFLRDLFLKLRQVLTNCVAQHGSISIHSHACQVLLGFNSRSQQLLQSDMSWERRWELECPDLHVSTNPHHVQAIPVVR